MARRTACFGGPQFKRSTTFGFNRLLFLLLLGNIFVGSWGKSDPLRGAASRSLEDDALLQHSFTKVVPTMTQIPHNTNLTHSNMRRRRSSSSAALPPKILTAAHLPSLRDLVSDKKITVRLGLRVSLTGPSELLDPQLLLSLNTEPAIYNIGEKAGLFSMRIVGIKKATSVP